MLINNEISHEDFMAIINEGKKYRELKESIRMMNSQKAKEIGSNEVIKSNKIINNSLKP